MTFIVATNVIASRPPERRPNAARLERRTLVPIVLLDNLLHKHHDKTMSNTEQSISNS